MTLHDISRLRRYWRRHPPLHMLAAAYVGFKPAEEMPALARDDPSVRIGVAIAAAFDRAQTSRTQTPGGADGMIAMFPDGKVRL